MADKNQCLANAQKINPKAVLCDDWICSSPEEESQLDKFCHCQPPFPVQNPCPYGANSPSPVYQGGKVCYCCCSCFAWETPIAVPTSVSKSGFKTIQTFEVNDTVYAAGSGLNWEEKTVEYSSGVSPNKDHGKTALTIYYDMGGTTSSLVVTPDHVFMLSDGSLKRAEFLDITKDELLTADGNPVHILAKELGGWFGGLHHIGTTNTVAESVEGHLLNSKGIVTGDWALQISNLVPSEYDENTPRFGTKAYVENMGGLEGDIFHVKVPGFDIDSVRPEDFKPYRLDSGNIPESASHFITKQQSIDIYENATQAPISSTSGKDIVHYLFKVFGAFYPDIQFRLLWDELLPNAHSWYELDVKFVVINGGLVRTEGVGFNELAVVIAHEIGHLIGGAPYEPGSTSCSCEGQADYAATSAILNGVFFPNLFLDIVIPGLDGVKTFFNYIDPAHKNGAPGNTCNYISIDCRLAAMEAGLSHKALPECAGGPKVDYLKIVSAKGTMTAKKTASIVVEYDQAVDGSSSLDKANYSITGATISKVSKGTSDKNVVITATLTAKNPTPLTAKNVTSKSREVFKGGKDSINITWS